jgi:DNA mismatch repair protein MutS2
MNSRALELLELPKILAQLESQCACELGRARVRKLMPSVNAGEVTRRLNETTQGKAFLDAGKNAPFGGISDIARFLKSAQIGAMLEASDLAAVGKFLAGSRALKNSIENAARDSEIENQTESENDERAPRREYSLLRHHTHRIEAQTQLEKSIADAIDFESEAVKDNASLRLLKARRSMARAQSEIQSKLRAMLSDSRVQPHLKDNFVTMREGRYCLPVRAESKNAVPGIVHDRSGSGGAFFIEPQAVVELNNRMRELMLEEREAIREVLQILSASVGGVAGELKSSLAACADLDLVFAKARLSRQHHAIAPVLADEGFHLIAARHPLVEHCIPNDIRLGEDFDVLLLTGPNTGGKTIVLKTLGLSVLMAMCGLHICADDGSTLCLPRQVFADIGDEQSIEQSLSTFSSHMKSIIAILNEAEKGDLVLFDEIGAGTDPDEGAALAKAILRTLSRRGVLVLATTHYGELKQFALSAERFQNASVEFDQQSLKPTYRLRIGVPGASNAIAIAARLGLAPELAQRAKRYLGKAREETELATQKLEETQRELREKTEGAETERAHVQRLQREFDEKLQQLQSQRDAEIFAAREDAARIVREAQEEADAILKELRRAGRESKHTEVARGRLRALRERTAERENGRNRKVEEKEEENVLPRHRPAVSPALLPLSPVFQKGDAVRVPSFNKEGVLLSAPDVRGRVEVRIGAMKVEVPISELMPVRQTGSTPAPVFAGHIFGVPQEVNLIGKRTDEAIAELEEIFDNAILANAKTLRIIHGRGTGALKRAVHDYLKNTRVVDSFELASADEGGEGATIVRF